MTDLPYVRAPAAGSRRAPWPVLFYAGVVTAGAAGFVAGRMTGAETAGMEWQLVFLLRFMAAVKGAMVLGALGLTQWRLRRPVGAGLALAYGGALALMATAPGLIWSLSHIALGAACFHAGLLAFLVTAWRDDSLRPSTRRA